ncbi:CfrBI family restriction endonuclease [Candidatus Woesearchaeota archaeon]|nr:CfrBI family restriction endonuclease [Candidatus Woesearchaeota archaeon]
MARSGKSEDLTSLMPLAGKELLSSSGKALVKRIGVESVRHVIHDVLCGENLRSSTELLTRRRIALANGALIVMFLNGCKNLEHFIDRLPDLATDQLKRGPSRRESRWILEWMLGLTEKAVQNILRDKPEELDKYTDEFKIAISEITRNLNKEFGNLNCTMLMPKVGKSRDMDWKFITHLLTAIGAQTLTIRGSEKSTYGKLFERLILGSLLHILGFKFVDKDTNIGLNKVFWLTSREEKRESDATVIYKPGKGIRFDIGFIGRGNTEISLDKVSRFERELEYGRSTHFMATFIIVDRVGPNSRLYEMARRINGTIIQMSMGYWPVEVAKQLKVVFGYEHEILRLPKHKIHEYLNRRLKEVPTDQFLA